MPGKFCTYGFSLIQLVFAMAIVAVSVAIAIPNFTNQLQKYERKKFVTELNAFMAEAWQQGLATQKAQKITFLLNTREVTLAQETGVSDTTEPVFAPSATQYAPLHLTWSERFEIKQFFVNGVEMLTAQQTTDTVWTFLVPGGLAQELIINILDVKNAPVDQDGKKMSLVLNPFTVQFKTYDDFQNPA